MSAAAQSASLPRTPSARRQQSAYASTPDRDRDWDRERPHRTQSTRHNSNAPASPRRSLSSAQAPPPPPPALAPVSHNRTPSNNLRDFARQDHEQANLVRPTSSRQSDSRERPMSSSVPSRSESTRQPAHSRTQSRYNSEQPMPAAPSANGGITPAESRTTTNSQNLRRRTTIDATTGHWDLGKTIGAGSMGKVKLARNKETGEQVAVKIVPRMSTDGEHRTQAERERADHSKEVRTAREAAIVTLVDHPYICGMRDVVRTNYHWYMLFEYVNGGQMLDYIISHGRLKEKQARKFGRQIASALDYCHRNSIVHRDLKIENILISKNGDIKIIDFGLSNLFSPRGYLKTFCGSLYFAAPELLQAKQYTGPEVDVWSFGIVLYVLVCGKVPFDDQSMPQLHAKIKRGNVEYPPWLSPECRGLISRMLNTNPSERAKMPDILTHPWMTKGFNGPPDNYLPTRRPLQLPLDPAVIEKMTGFDFGPSDVISAQLTKEIESEDYQRAVRAAERLSNQPTPDMERKRGVFDFYKRRNSTTSRDTLNTPSSEAVQLGNDPINAYSPLMSVYHLAAEKLEREAHEKNPGALAIPPLPQAAGENPLQVPELSAPEAAYTNSQAYEMAGENPTGGRARPRARTHGEDEVQQGMANLNVGNAPLPAHPAIVEPMDQQATSTPKKEGTVAGLLRRVSTRRYRDSPPERPERGERPTHPPPSLAVFTPADTPRKSFSVRRQRDSSATGLRPEMVETAKRAELLTPPAGGDGQSDHSSKRAHGLGRSVSVNSSDIRRRLTRRGVSEGASMRPSMNSPSGHDRNASLDHASMNLRDVASDAESAPQSGSGGGGLVAGRTKSLGHTRRESMQARRARRGVARTSDVPEETDQELQGDELDGGEGGRSGGDGSNGSFKPVYLKGVFSVSTTSGKPPHFIRADIIRVLQQLGIEYMEIKGGFKCRHAPSIKAVAPAADDAGLLSPDAAAAAAAAASAQQKRKISFGGFRSGSERDAFRAQQQQPGVPSTPRGGVSGKPSYATGSEEDSEEEEEAVAAARSKAEGMRPRAAGETSTHVQSDLGNDMVLKFEIFVVKVPLLSLHGIQFKKVEGGTWQYKNMAQTILDELRL